MNENKWLKIFVICFLMLFAATFVLNFILMYQYMNVPISELPMWVWWMLK